MAAPRRVVRRIPPARASFFEETAWPFMLAVLAMAGVVAYLALERLRFDDPVWWRNAWFVLAGVLLTSAATLAGGLRFTGRRARRFQFAMAVSLFMHLWIALACEQVYLALIAPDADNSPPAPTQPPERVTLPEYYVVPPQEEQVQPLPHETPVETELPDGPTLDVARAESFSLRSDPNSATQSTEGAPETLPNPMPVPRDAPPAAPRRNPWTSQLSRSQTETRLPTAQPIETPAMERPREENVAINAARTPVTERTATQADVQPTSDLAQEPVPPRPVETSAARASAASDAPQVETVASQVARAETAPTAQPVTTAELPRQVREAADIPASLAPAATDAVARQTPMNIAAPTSTLPESQALEGISSPVEAPSRTTAAQPSVVAPAPSAVARQSVNPNVPLDVAAEVPNESPADASQNSAANAALAAASTAQSRAATSLNSSPTTDSTALASTEISPAPLSGQPATAREAQPTAAAANGANPRVARQTAESAVPSSAEMATPVEMAQVANASADRLQAAEAEVAQAGPRTVNTPSGPTMASSGAEASRVDVASLRRADQSQGRAAGPSIGGDQPTLVGRSQVSQPVASAPLAAEEPAEFPREFGHENENSLAAAPNADQRRDTSSLAPGPFSILGGSDGAPSAPSIEVQASATPADAPAAQGFPANDPSALRRPARTAPNPGDAPEAVNIDPAPAIAASGAPAADASNSLSESAQAGDIAKRASTPGSGTPTNSAASLAEQVAVAAPARRRLDNARGNPGSDTVAAASRVSRATASATVAAPGEIEPAHVAEQVAATESPRGPSAMAAPSRQRTNQTGDVVTSQPFSGDLPGDTPAITRNPVAAASSSGQSRPVVRDDLAAQPRRSSRSTANALDVGTIAGPTAAPSARPASGQSGLPELPLEVQRRASRAVTVAAPTGSGGFGPTVTTEVGLPSRLARRDSDVLQPSVGRFLRRDVGAPATLDIRARDSAQSFAPRAERLRNRSQGDAGPYGERTERAIELGLRYLAGRQQTDGRWQLHDQDRGPGNEEPGSQALQSDVAATGLALLAFMGAGYDHFGDVHRQKIDAGLRFLVEGQRPDGDLFVPEDSTSNQSAWLYSHAIATIALCEALGMTGDETLREPAEKAIRFILISQNPELGGWRYIPGSESDTSVTGWMLMALKSGELAGISVPQEAYSKVEGWLAEAQDSRGARYVYNPYAPDTARRRQGRQPTPTMTAVGLLMRLYLGWNRDQPAMQAGADYLLDNPPRIGTVRSKERDTYYWYYATQVMFHMQGTHWESWNQRLHALLVDTQLPRGSLAGSWDPLSPVPDRWGPHAGRVYVTAMNLLSLEVYYRHLPIYDTPIR